MKPGEGISLAFEVIERVANESNDRVAFYQGMVFGLAHAKGFLVDKTLPTDGAIDALLDLLDERIFQPLEANHQ